MKISLTGTFDVPREAFEKKLGEAGFEVVSFSGKTEVLLVGEKTASPNKVAKAEKAGIRIIREIDSQKIISLILDGNGDVFELYHDASCNGVVVVGRKFIFFDDCDDSSAVYVYNNGEWEYYKPRKPFDSDYTLIDESGALAPDWVEKSLKSRKEEEEKAASELPSWIKKKIGKQFPDFEFEEE